MANVPIIIENKRIHDKMQAEGYHLPVFQMLDHSMSMSSDNPLCIWKKQDTNDGIEVKEWTS